MKVSVIIPTYNRDSLLRTTLKSLSNQSFSRSDFEVIVVDDGSSDKSMDVCNEFEELLNITYLFQEDLGYRVSQARNLGISHAKGSILIFLDSGIITSTNFISSHYSTHYNNATSSDATYAVVGYIFGTNQNLHYEDLPHKFNIDCPDEAIEQLGKSELYIDTRESAFSEYFDKLESMPAPWCLFWSGNISVTSELLNKSGIFEENFKSWGIEDIEFGYRLFKAGAQFKLQRSATGLHIPHSRNQSINNKTNGINKIAFFEKHPSIETELYINSSARKFNYEISDFFNNQSRQLYRKNFPILRFRKYLNKLKLTKNTLLIGIADPLLISHISPSTIIENCSTTYSQIIEKFPDIAVFNRLGVYTTFNDKKFDVCFVCILESHSSIYINKLFTEALRISKSLVVVTTSDISALTRYKMKETSQLSAIFSAYVVSQS
ncbi:glycosyltransferase [Teredinibacter sp. KSP-S5-2]|uniref:glycosyltransferase n=1 Tax=Teredinibacter sp. KSP-S5-2 TaxID=3034506 RepID=UPI002934B1E6|nr:glycosyltransferase [Teredinibacter sp. KSP-S5-2]WNO11610.1 glycosyltransferase [Teredinibacter sp. KSP-S5-2]